MSEAGVDVTGVRRHLFRPKLKGWLERTRHQVLAYRPRFRDRRFWAVQGFVILIAVMHALVEADVFFHDVGMLYFIPTTLFLVPVVYAALVFGFSGAVATALWATVITIPNWVFWHQGLETFGCMFQLLVVNAVAFFVGQQVDRERNAWQHSEAAGAALRASEMKYQRLFDSSPIAILVLAPAGTILDANPTAGILFNRTPETLKSMAVADLVGTVAAQKLLSPSQNDKRRKPSLTLRLGDGSKVHLEPMLTHVSDSQGNLAIQVLLGDVTEEHHRQAGLRAYAAYVIRAQEEERQRISRELHDETIQTLVLLCHQLDSVEDPGRSLPSSAINGLRKARRTAEEIVKWLRDFNKALRPPILDDLGIVASIRRLLVDFKERTRIEGQLKVLGEERRLPSDRELGIFRIAQEALRNVERHARATHVSVAIAFAKHEASLDVLDNGVGFIVAPVSGDFTASGQLGLIGMQERAKLLGGKLEIQSSPRKGTQVTASIPI